MSFLSPLFLFGALAAAIPIVLHLLRRETEARVRFSAVKLLKHAPVEAASRQRLREWLLLALRVAALLLLALAFARPFVVSGAAGGSTGITVVALDTSLSLSAPGQFARAQRLARDAVDQAPAGDAVGVVTFADTARVAAAPGAERAIALAAIDQASAGFGATDYRAALNAAAAVPDGARLTIVVVTDLQESGWDAGDRVALPESARVEIADVGEPPPNLAVTGVRVDGDRIIGMIHGTGGAARDARVRLVVDGKGAGEAAVTIEPGRSVEVAFGGARGTEATVSVEDAGGIMGDNARYVVLNYAGRPSVLVVTSGGDPSRDAFYVEQALVAEGADGADYSVAGVGASQLSSLSPGSPGDNGRLDEQAAVVLLSTRGLERRGRDRLAAYLGRGGGVLAAAGDDVDGAVLADLLGGPSILSLGAVVGGESEGGARTLAPSDARHPVFQPFGAGGASLGLVRFQRFVTMGGTGCQTLARFTSGEPALVDCAAGEGRALVFASDLGNRWNDFPLHATFVPFLHEAVRYVSGTRPRRGEYLVGDVPEGVPSKPGMASVSDAAGTPRAIAVNVDPSEADIRRLSAGEFQAAVTRLQDASRSAGPVQAQQQEDRQHVWRYVLALMAATLVVESVVARRTA